MAATRRLQKVRANLINNNIEYKHFDTLLMISNNESFSENQL